jgi:hypothetical protein
MYFKLKNIEDSNFNIPVGVTTLVVDNCPLFEAAPAGVTYLRVDSCPLYKNS